MNKKTMGFVIKDFCKSSLQNLFRSCANEGFDNKPKKNVYTQLEKGGDFNIVDLEEVGRMLKDYVYTTDDPYYADLFFDFLCAFEFYYAIKDDKIQLGVFCFEYEQEDYEKQTKKVMDGYTKRGFSFNIISRSGESSYKRDKKEGKLV